MIVMKEECLFASWVARRKLSVLRKVRGLERQELVREGQQRFDGIECRSIKHCTEDDCAVRQSGAGT